MLLCRFFISILCVGNRATGGPPKFLECVGGWSGSKKVSMNIEFNIIYIVMSSYYWINCLMHCVFCIFLFNVITKQTHIAVNLNLFLSSKFLEISLITILVVHKTEEVYSPMYEVWKHPTVFKENKNKSSALKTEY